MKKFLTLIAATAALSACGGGGNGDGAPATPGSPSYTHNELAAAFVASLNATGEYDVTLAKDSTEQYNYIVIYDHDLAEYDAVSLTGYLPGQDPVKFLETKTTVYYDLIYYPGYWDTYVDSWGTVITVWEPDLYEDWYTGLVFEKVQSSSKDLEKFAALAEESVIEDRAEAVASKFGLSVNRSKEVVRLAMAWKAQGGKNLSVRDQDAFSNSILGFSITEAKKAAVDYAAGDKSTLNELMDVAVRNNEGMTAEGAQQLVGEYFGVQ